MPASNTPALERVPASARVYLPRVNSVPYLKDTTTLDSRPISVTAPLRVAPVPVTPVTVVVATLTVGITTDSATNDKIPPQTSPVEVVAHARK
jgi:hypothetical protein